MAFYYFIIYIIVTVLYSSRGGEHTLAAYPSKVAVSVGQHLHFPGHPNRCCPRTQYESVVDSHAGHSADTLGGGELTAKVGMAVCLSCYTK